MIKQVRVDGYGLKYSNIVLGQNIIVGKVLSEERQYGITGLGLKKFEREILGYEKFKIADTVNLYLGRIILTFHKKGYKHLFRKMEIVGEKKYL